MKLFLFGWAELDKDHLVPQLKLMEQVIKDVNPKQVFHIPFARSPETEIARGKDWFTKNVHLWDIEYLDARIEEDILKVDNPFVVITGGGNNLNLFEKINWDKRLLDIVNNADYIIGESAGAMILWEYFRVKTETWTKLIKAFNILKDTIIEPHYADRNRQVQLQEEIIEKNVRYWLGIDCVTAIEFDTETFPNNYKKIWIWNIEIKINWT